jgi:dienelactone hydrolase
MEIQSRHFRIRDISVIRGLPEWVPTRTSGLVFFQSFDHSINHSVPVMRLRAVIVLTGIISSLPSAVWGDAPFRLPAAVSARDTLTIGEEPDADARDCLQGLAWTPGAFEVLCRDPLPDRGDALVRFPSPVATGDERNDLVALEWYFAQDESRQPCRAPAVVVVHESGSAMTVGRLFAKQFQQRGVHAFLLHLPHYGERRSGKKRPDAANLVPVLRQAVADVRRARDAVAVLPLVDGDCIALQGTSLGGFVSATTAGLDRGYDRVFLMLAGGNLYDVIQTGARDAARLRDDLSRAGLTGEALRTGIRVVEPTRLAHRIDPTRTWLFSARYDDVVPPRNADLLARSAQLDDTHHVRLPADHYTGIVFLPFAVEQMVGTMIVSPQKSP